jgi:ketosteroid isomerase-like protein
MNTLQRAVRVVAIVVCAMSIYTQAAQSQEEEVREQMLASLAAWNEGNVEVFGEYYGAEARGFNLDGGPLIRGFNPAALQAAMAAGFGISVEPRDVDVKLYGDMAVGVAYLDGRITLPGGATRDGTWRYSDTRIKEGATWKVVQYHISLMSVGAPEP